VRLLLCRFEIRYCDTTFGHDEHTKVITFHTMSGVDGGLQCIVALGDTVEDSLWGGFLAQQLVEDLFTDTFTTL